MIRVLFLLLLTMPFAEAYVPTVESLFRQGSNPDVSANGAALTLSVKRMLSEKVEDSSLGVASLSQNERLEDFYKLFFTRVSGDTLKIAQTRYSNQTFSEAALEHKIYYPNFTPYTVKPGVEHLERGVFFSLLNSLIFNNGSHLVTYLKSMGAPVRLNSELINRDKLELYASYKRYLVLINKDRSARKTETNPLRPEDPAARARVEQILREPMYIDTKQVQLGKDEGQIAWLVKAGPFEAVVSYKEREVQKIRYKSQAGDLEILCKDYWLANGTHRMPRYMIVKSLSGAAYQVEISNMRHYVEREDDLVKRLRNWDQILKGKESQVPRSEFLL